MAETEDRIKQSDWRIGTFIDLLRKNQYQIPTFQRDFEWDSESIKKLWDSIFNYYPIGSLLIWRTDIRLHRHRKIGGFAFPEDSETLKEYAYILDGQQRATSLFASYEGLVINDFDYTLYFDFTKKEDNFCFKADAERRIAYKQGMIVKVSDVDKKEEAISNLLEKQFDYDSIERKNFRKIKNCLSNYPLMFIDVRGIKVKEVCEIFERINREGKKLDIVDILVAKTYRPKNEDKRNPEEFYLRDYLQELKNILKDGEYANIDDLLIMQIILLHIKQEFPALEINNITERNLEKISAEQIEQVWSESKKAIIETIRLFGDRLNLKGPNIIPYNYLYLPISYYFYKNNNPNYEFVKQWFWRTCFNNEPYSKGEQVLDYCNLFNDLRNGKEVIIPSLILNKWKFRTCSYSFRNAYAKALLAFYAYMGPVDFEDTDLEVLRTVYMTFGDKPNLHHIFPKGFLESVNQDKVRYDKDSLMNIAYLSQKTNLSIGKESPENYFKEYAKKNPNIKEALTTHLIPESLLNLNKFSPEDFNKFIETRTDYLIDAIIKKLNKVKITVIDEIQ